MKQRNKQFVRQIALKANVEEVMLFERIKEHYQRNSDSDMLRVLIKEAGKKIFAKGTTKAV